MFIDYTPYDGQHVGDNDSEMIAIGDISRISPSRGGTAWIYTKSGTAIQTACSVDRLRQKIAKVCGNADAVVTAFDLVNVLRATMDIADHASITALQFEDWRATLARVQRLLASAIT